MSYLLDTHCFLWAIKEPNRLSKRIATLLLDNSLDLVLSAVSIWEIAIKSQTGKLDTPHDPSFFERHSEAIRLRRLPVHVDHANAVFHLPGHHQDPFDRILVAQAQVEGLTIITADPLIGKYDVRVIW